MTDEFDPFANGAAALPDADPDEEPPDPVGRVLTDGVAEILSEDAYTGEIPSDLAAVWCPPRARPVDEQTCRVLIGAWGVDGFRASALHTAALQAMASDALTAEARSDMKKTVEKKKARR